MLDARNLLFLLAASSLATGCPDASDDDDDSGGDSGGTSGDGDAGPCESYASKSAECLGASYYEALLGYCQSNLANADTVGEGCGAAYEQLLVCVSGLSCDEFVTQEPCADQQDAVGTACN